MQTNIMLDVYSFNHNPSVFPEPFVFNPARFANPTQTRPHLFGIGSRPCMGQYWVRHVSRLLLANTVLRYTLELAPNQLHKAVDDVQPYQLARAPFIHMPDVWLRFTERE